MPHLPESMVNLKQAKPYPPYMPTADITCNGMTDSVHMVLRLNILQCECVLFSSYLITWAGPSTTLSMAPRPMLASVFLPGKPEGETPMPT